MEEEMKFPKNQSVKLISKIKDPATSEKKSKEFSPSILSNRSKNKIKSKKLNTILKKDSKFISGKIKQDNNLKIQWDNKSIDEQNEYRSRHRLSNAQKYKMKSLSRTKYNSAVIGAEEDDEYLKNLIKVNQITVTDDLIKNIIKLLNEPNDFKKTRTKSSYLKTPYNFNLNAQVIRSARENLHAFDNVLDYERKLTLKNTVINKFHKEVLGVNS